MSAPTINGNRPAVTVGSDVRVCVRAQKPAHTPEPAHIQPETARFARDIAHATPDRHAQRSSKIRNFASPHVEGVREAVATSWPLTERPQSLAVVARNTFPAKGEAGNPVVWVGMTLAGMWRTFWVAVFQLGQLAVATRIRSAATAGVFAAVWLAHIVAAHIH